MTITETATERCARLCPQEPISAARLVSLELAHQLVTDEVYVALATAPRVSRQEYITLPAGRYEGLSRGRGWCRHGKGGNATWGERTEKGYRVSTVGAWLIYATDGYNRNDEVTWAVSRIVVGVDLWTIAV